MLSIRHTEQIVSPRYMRIWLILSFQAGAINAGGFLACHRFVSHVTGFVTLFGIEFSARHYGPAIGLLSVPLFFLLGAMLSGFFVDRRLQKQQQPRHTIVLGLVLLCLLLSAALGELGFFGNFGNNPEMSEDYMLMALLCLASGLQNALTTSLSFSTVRNTHLTGALTDLGIGFVRLLGPIASLQDKNREQSLALLRLLCIFTFTLGSLIAAKLYFSFAYLAFLLPAFTAACLWLVETKKQFKTEEMT